MDNSIELKELRRLYNQRGEGLDTARERIAELTARAEKAEAERDAAYGNYGDEIRKNDALKADLDEAVGAIHAECKECRFNDGRAVDEGHIYYKRCPIEWCKTKPILAKHGRELGYIAARSNPLDGPIQLAAIARAALGGEKVSRELDRDVAEKVVGWRYREDDGGFFAPGDEWFVDQDGLRVECVDLPTYSTSISAAWEVVEKMREIGFTYVQIEACFDGGWRVAFGLDPMAIVKSANTAPLAICKAALAAVEAESYGPDGEDGPWADGWEERSKDGPELQSAEEVE